ncbi:dual specificity phosphatase, catalytic domain protein [Rhizoctonia solani AG-3 Rhs1AP]|uniref:protein-tyrosine-phosphatase n=1 Tax=Rhizoctonia solani AG-3 Rhs1AP TaxID=1086054 RepID=X8IVL6_9AGAM|nr:dual specificity phosphatase, catalytic domain protein [Rhizoctonia solani AG-3 Rhs1AP]
MPSIAPVPAPVSLRKKGPPSGLRIRVDSNASTSSLLPTTGSQPSLVLDVSPATLSAAPSTAETPSSPLVIEQVSIQIADAAPVPAAQPPSEQVPLPFPRKRISGRNLKQLSLQLPSSAASHQSTFSIGQPSTQVQDDSDAASSSNVTVQERPQSHAFRPPTLTVPPPPRPPFRARSSSIASVTSVASLQVPGHIAATGAPMPAPTSAFATRAKEDDNGAPYANGPIEILPGIWLGQEENARNWSDLASRGIRWVLNVAKEVAPPYMDDAPTPVDPREPPKTAVDERLRIRPSASNPNLAQPQSAFLSRRRPGPPPAQTEQPQPRAVPFVPPTGDSPLLYIHLPWSHGQSDLVRSGFPTAMSFVDHAQRKGQGVLIHCQCGVSRSATLVIALVMRASMAAEVPDDLKSIQGGMHNAYAYVKEKSKWVGPNMSLIYQLTEYERALTPSKGTSSVSSDGSELSEEEEWSRKRLAMEREDAEAEAATAADEDRTREAKDLDRAMEERMAAKKAGPPAPLMLNPPPAPGVNAWRNRFPSRKRAGSVHSTFTTSDSIISEDPEEDEDSEDGEANTTAVAQTRIELVLSDETSVSARTTTDEEASPSAKYVSSFADTAPKLLAPPPGKVGMKHKRSASLAITANSLPSLPPPPSAPAFKMSFGIPTPLTATRTSFGVIPPAPLLRRSGPRGLAPPSAPAIKPGFSFPAPGSRAPSIKPHSSSKRPTPLATVPSSPVAVPTLATPKSSRARPPPLRLPVTPPTHVTIVPSSSAPQQTLFVFPPDRSHTTCTPSTLTLTTMTPRVDKFANPGPGVTPTPRKGSFGATRKLGTKRMSWLGVGAVPATPTTACSRVDAKGWVG